MFLFFQRWSNTWAIGKQAEIQQVFLSNLACIFQRRLHALFSSRKDKFAMRLFKLSWVKRIETRALQEM